MIADTDDQHFVRADLLTFPPDGRRQAVGWDRLRRVCLELGLRVPTRAEVLEMDQDLVGAGLELARRWNLFDEEIASAVICARTADGVAVLCQFSAGYVFESVVTPNSDDDKAPRGET
jgi:hypothetical protein